MNRCASGGCVRHPDERCEWPRPNAGFERSRGEYRAVALQRFLPRHASLDGFTSIERDVTLVVGTETTLDFTLTRFRCRHRRCRRRRRWICLEPRRHDPPPSSSPASWLRFLKLAATFLSWRNCCPVPVRSTPPSRGPRPRSSGGVADQRSGLHDADRRWRHRRRAVGESDDQPDSGERSGIQGLPLPVRRAVRQGAEHRRVGRDQERRQRRSRERLLFRS